MKNKAKIAKDIKVKIVGYLAYFVFLSVIVLFLIAQVGIFDKKTEKNKAYLEGQKQNEVKEITKTETAEAKYLNY